MNITLAKSKLKDVCKIEKGKIGITKAIEGEYPLVVTAEERSSHNEWHFDEPAAIVPLVSSTGHGHASIKRLHYAEGKYAVGNILATLIPMDHKYLNAKYLYVYLTINKEELLVSQMTGAANVSLTLTRLAEVEIEVPDYETQLKVIKKYEDAQRYKNSMNSQIETRSELLEKFRQQILQDAITGKLSEKWRKENPNIESAEILLGKIKAEKERLVEEGKIRRQKPSSPIEESEIPFDLPEGWIWCRLGEILTKLTDGAHQTPGYVDEGIPFLSVKDISSGKIDFSNTKYITEEEHSELYSRCNPEFGDVLLTKVGTTGIAKVVDTHREFSLFVSVALLKFNQNLVYNYFLEYLINSPFVKRQSERETKGMGNQNLVLSKISNFLIPLPSIVEQHHIVARIESLLTKLDRIKETHIENQTNIDQINHILLKEMFKG